MAVNFDQTPGDLLFLIVAAGGPTAATTIGRIEAELANGPVRVIATPQAAEWLDHAVIEALTGWPLQSDMLTPAAPVLDPPGHRVLATPVTLNTLTKWADGHADNLAIGLLCEALGSGVPIRAELSLSVPFARHPAVAPALARLSANANVSLDTHPASSLSITDLRDLATGN
ncbi:MAG: flavoprotein [Actinomycetota bacterium]